MLIDHISLSISDVERSKQFYTRVLATLDIEQVGETHGWIGFGRNGKGDFWFGVDDEAQHPMHFAFLAESRAQVDAFHAAAIKAGGKDNGKPGLRPEYHPDYYGAFIIDPDGHNIEAVCHQG